MSEESVFPPRANNPLRPNSSLPGTKSPFPGAKNSSPSLPSLSNPAKLPVSAPPKSLRSETPRPTLNSVEPTLAPIKRTPNPSFAPVRPPEEPMDIEIEEVSASKGSGIPNIDDMLEWMLDQKGSDLFLSANSAPKSEVHGRLEAVPGFGPLSDKEVEATVYSILSDKQRQKFEETKELDCSYAIPGRSRFRVNVFRSKGSVSAVLRTIPFDIKPIEALGLPSSIAKYAKLPRGLVLVTGPTGSGKSTTLAAIIDLINNTQKGHILTIEDPIEFVHPHKECIVNQREVGTDTDSFQNALKAALREAPNYILVGEMRDYETISLAITMAETGHLVFGTLHTNSAPETISRIVDVFPADQQEQVKTQLAASLQAVICQNLVRTADGKGRVAVIEIMNTTTAIRSKIKKGHLDAIVSEMQTGSTLGMQTMDSDLEDKARQGVISIETAIEKAHKPSYMVEAFGGEEEVNKLIEVANKRSGRRG